MGQFDMDVKGHRKVIVIFFGLLIILYLAKIFGILNEELVFLYETKILKTITDSVISMLFAFLGFWVSTAGTVFSKGIDFGISPDTVFHGCKRGKSHSFVIPSIILVISVFVPSWIKPFLIGYSLGYSIHVIVDWVCNSNAFSDKRLLWVSFIVYVVLIILFELF